MWNITYQIVLTNWEEEWMKEIWFTDARVSLKSRETVLPNDKILSTIVINQDSFPWTIFSWKNILNGQIFLCQQINGLRWVYWQLRHHHDTDIADTVYYSLLSDRYVSGKRFGKSGRSILHWTMIFVSEGKCSHSHIFLWELKWSWTWGSLILCWRPMLWYNGAKYLQLGLMGPRRKLDKSSG